MTLPASGPITFAQIRAEIGGSGPIVLPSTETRTLSGVASGPIVCPNDFWGKSSLSPAPSGTTLLSKTSSGAWSYTHSGYAAQTITVEIWGGGGSGSSSNTGGKSPVIGDQGGGGGGYSKETYSIAASGTISGSVGAGGVAPGSTNTNGNAGGATTCSQTGQTANGGGGSTAGSAGGAGGTASGGNVTNTTGEAGTNVLTPADLSTAYGGASPNGGARRTGAGAGNAPGGGSCAANTGAIGKVLVKAQ